jgi:hypothetical protein
MCIQDKDGETYKLGMRLDNSDDKYALRQQFVLDHDALSFLRRIIKLSKSISEVSGGDLQNHELNVEPEDFSVDDLEHGEVNLTVAQILVEAKLDKFDDFPRWYCTRDSATQPSF